MSKNSATPGIVLGTAAAAAAIYVLITPTFNELRTTPKANKNDDYIALLVSTTAVVAISALESYVTDSILPLVAGTVMVAIVGGSLFWAIGNPISDNVIITKTSDIREEVKTIWEKL